MLESRTQLNGEFQAAIKGRYQRQRSVRRRAANDSDQSAADYLWQGHDATLAGWMIQPTGSPPISAPVYGGQSSRSLRRQRGAWQPCTERHGVACCQIDFVVRNSSDGLCLLQSACALGRRRPGDDNGKRPVNPKAAQDVFAQALWAIAESCGRAGLLGQLPRSSEPHL